MLAETRAPNAWIHADFSEGLSDQRRLQAPSLRGPAKPAAAAAPASRNGYNGSSGNPTAFDTTAMSPATRFLGASVMGAVLGWRRRRGNARHSVCATSKFAQHDDFGDCALPDLEAEPEDVEVFQCEPVSISRGKFVQLAGIAAVGVGSFASNPVRAVTEEEAAEAAAEAGGGEAQLGLAEWIQYDLNTGETLYDIDFDEKDTSRGFIVGARGLFYETRDGGKRWVSRSFANLSKSGEISYRFQNVTVNGDEVWIVGKPALLLHSKDGGKSWKKVPVSNKLPGDPKLIKSLGPGAAEMATSSGAVYITDNDGRNWKSIVKETVDATLNRVSASGIKGASYFTGSVKSIKRDPTGKYIAIAQRGNFYLTYVPGDVRWVPHNRVSARRIQAMGFRDTGDGSPWEGVWMSLNGGYLMSCNKSGYRELDTDTKGLFNFNKIRTGGIGIIDIAFRNPMEAWAVGGKGVIYQTTDGGKTWSYDPSGNELPCNLYNIKFFKNGKVGYMIGSSGILLRKEFKGVSA